MPLTTENTCVHLLDIIKKEIIKENDISDIPHSEEISALLLFYFTWGDTENPEFWHPLLKNVRIW